MKIKILIIYLYLILRNYGEITITQEPSGNLTTNMEPIFTVRSSTSWTPQCIIKVKLVDDEVLIYLPYHQKIVTYNRNLLNYNFSNSELIFELKFDKIRDGEKYLKIFYTSGINDIIEKYSNLIEFDYIAQPILTWRHYKNSKKFKGIKHVNDKIEIICIKVNGFDNDKIEFILPAKIEVVETPNYGKNIKKVIIALVPETDNEPVTCKIGQRFVTSHEILSIDSDLKDRIEDGKYILRGTEAILNVVFFGFIFVPIGMYLVLIKQRSIYTKKKIKKITNAAQEQMHMIQTNAYIPGKTNIILDEAGLSHSRNFNRKLNQVRAQKLGYTNIEQHMNKIEELHDLAKLELAVVDAE